MNPPTQGPERSVGYSIMLWIYQAGFLLFGLGYLCLRFLRARALPGWRDRLALYGKQRRQTLRRQDRPVWIHLVSVGEVRAVRPLLSELRRRHPGLNWVITTVTPTGQLLAKELVRGPQDQLLYLPWDFGPVVRRAVAVIRPRLFLAFETELWPVLFEGLSRAGVPIAVLNGRVSPSAYRRYLWVRPWMERVLSRVSVLFTQSPQDGRRYAGIGAAMDRIVVTGNLKWDLDTGGHSNDTGEEEFKRLLGLEAGSSLWTAGSTHRGEEQAVLQAYSFLAEKFPGLRLLIAPRHPERVGEVEQEAARIGLSTVRRSELKTQRGLAPLGNFQQPKGPGPVIILDTLGELSSFYQISDIVFVGGSLIPHGGHNLVEPAAFSRPILTGPHLWNFEAIAQALRQAGGIAVVKSSKELQQRAGWLLENPRAAQEMGSKAFSAIQEHRGAALRTADLIGLRWGKLLGFGCC